MGAGSSTAWKLLLLTAGTLGLAACASPTGGAAPGPAEGIDSLSERLAGLVERLGPGLVQIRTGPAAGPGARPPAAGFIVDASGIVLTVAHAVPGEDRVDVGLSDGRRLHGSVIGRDARTDLAVVRVEDGGDLTALPLGDSDRIRVGEIVLALGHPYGLLRAASLGIVSWKGPPPEGGLPGFDFLHTDALVNPGNSGGPLVNLAGEVIGVNSLAARNGSMGIAVPASLVELVLPRLVAEGRVSWGWLGVDLGADRDDAREEGGQAMSGVLVRGVTPGGPAQEAGLAAGDRLVAVDGEAIERPRDLHRLLMAPPEGRRARIDVLRDGRRREIEVSLRPYGETGGDIRAGIDFPSIAPRDHRMDGTF